MMNRHTNATLLPMAAEATALPSIPCTFLKVGESGKIERVSGIEEVRKFLIGLGFVNGTVVKAVSNNSTGLILEIKGSKVAVDKKMAAKIHVTSEC